MNERPPRAKDAGFLVSACSKRSSRFERLRFENGIACRSADATDRTSIVVEGEELVVFDRAVRNVARLERLPFAQWYPVEVGETPAWIEGRTK